MHSGWGCWDMVQEKGSRERCSSWTVLHAVFWVSSFAR